MAHTIVDKRKLLARVGRIRGQVEALEKALAREEDCSKILHQIAAARGAMNGLMAEVLEGHVRFHVAGPDRNPRSGHARAVEDLIDVLKTYLR